MAEFEQFQDSLLQVTKSIGKSVILFVIITEDLIYSLKDTLFISKLKKSSKKVLNSPNYLLEVFTRILHHINAFVLGATLLVWYIMCRVSESATPPICVSDP